MSEPAASGAVKGHVLVVDDNAVNRTMLARYLTREGHTSESAENGRIALEMIRNTSFDLILLDVEMPEMDGYELLATLKDDDRLRDIPVIMISAIDEIENVVRCIEQGAEDYLPKPFNPVLLRARVGACLEKKRFRDQEVLYLEQVNRVAAAASSVEAQTFEPESLDEVGRRDDALGQLARVFTRMAREVREREQRLQRQVRQLSIEIDRAREAKQVAEITETDYFRALQQKAKKIRKGEEGRVKSEE
ncbi:MAG TPA: response regulator [Thermoanaerobaculia bacterium]|nr:response regulator [Thermoanaerobaculia bacterium]